MTTKLPSLSKEEEEEEEVDVVGGEEEGSSVMLRIMSLSNMRMFASMGCSVRERIAVSAS